MAEYECGKIYEVIPPDGAPNPNQLILMGTGNRGSLIYSVDKPFPVINDLNVDGYDLRELNLDTTTLARAIQLLIDKGEL